LIQKRAERLAELASLNARTVQKIEAGQLNIVLRTLKRVRPKQMVGDDVRRL
jgi:hypothetical protein